jgi:hypothetical protein
MAERAEERVRRTFDHMQRIHGLAPSDLPEGASIGDEHHEDHTSGRFEHSESDLFLYIEE